MPSSAHSVTTVTYTSYTVFCPLSKIIYYLSFPIKNTIFSIVNIWKSSDRSDCPIQTDTGTTQYALWGFVQNYFVGPLISLGCYFLYSSHYPCSGL